MVERSSNRLQISNTAAGRASVTDSQVRAGVLRTVKTAVMTAERLSSEMTARPHSESSRTGSSRMTRICTAEQERRGLLAQGGPPAGRPRRRLPQVLPDRASWPHCRGGWATMPVCRAPCCSPSSPAPSCSLVSGVAKLRAPETVDSGVHRARGAGGARHGRSCDGSSPWVEVALGAVAAAGHRPRAGRRGRADPAALRRLPGARRAGRAPPRAGRLRLLRGARGLPR